MKKGFKRSFVLVSLLTLTGCPSTQLKQGEVQKKWSQSLRQLGIVPIFPPREDFYVGDIYVTNFDPESQETRALFNADIDDLSDTEKSKRLEIGMNSRLHRIDLSKILLDEYTNSISAPPSTVEYNTILENPTLAAIDTKISAQKMTVDKFKNKIKHAEKEEFDATSELKDATRAKVDADAKVTEAQTALTKAQSKKPDVTEEKSQLTKLKIEKRDIEDEVLDASRAVADSPSDESDPQRIAASTQKTNADRKLSDHNTKISRLTEDIQTKEAEKPDTSTEEKNFKTAEDNQTNSQGYLNIATRNKEDATERKTKVTSENNPKVTEEEGKLTKLNELKANVQIAGSKHLYSQPQYADRDIFTGTDSNLLKDENGKPIPNDRINRLRLVGFPEFASTSVSQGDLSALIPAEALAINITASKIKSVTVKIPSAESYGISFSHFFEEVFTRKVGNKLMGSQDDATAYYYYDFNDKYKDPLTTMAHMQAGADENKSSRYLYFRFVTEVFYARAIDVSIFGSEKFGGLLETAKPLEANDTDSGKDTGNTNEPTSEDFTGVINASAGSSNDGFLSSIKSNLGRTQTVPGGAIQLLSASEQSIGMRRVYDRPIAIGFRAVNIKYDLCNNEPDIKNDKEVRSIPFLYTPLCDGAIDSVVVSHSPVPSFL